MQYPGQRIQIDVKFVPSACLVGDAAGQKFYQYTAIDEYSRFRYLEAFEEHSTYSSSEFVKHLIKMFPYAIECIQTDNGLEFTNRLCSGKPKQTLFEKTLAELGIQHKLIKPYTPRHNGIDIRFGDPNKEDKPGVNIILPKDPGYIKHEEADINHFRQSLIKKSVKKAGVEVPTQEDLEFLAAETKTDVEFVKKTLGL